MERKTYIVTVDEKSSFVGVMPAFSNSRYDKVTITKPVSVTPLDGYPVLYTSKALEKERQEGQNEAWELAQRILRRYECGGYTIADLRQAFEVTEVVPDRDVAGVCILMEDFATASSNLREVESRPKRFDVVMVQFGDDKKEAVVTKVDGDQIDLMFRGGGTCRRYISAVTKTGETLEYGLLKWVEGEE